VRRFWKREKPQASDDPTALCNILLGLGWANQEKIKRALDTKGDRLIGGLLVEQKVITLDQLEDALLRQRMARGKISQKEMTAIQIGRTVKMQSRVTDSFKELAVLGRSVAAASASSKFVPVKRESK
jgi:hypothetical protein